MVPVVNVGRQGEFWSGGRGGGSIATLCRATNTQQKLPILAYPGVREPKEENVVSHSISMGKKENEMG